MKDNHNEKHDHSDHHNHDEMIKDFKGRFIVSLVVTIPILLLSTMIQEWFNFTIEFTTRPYVLFILSTGIFIYGGWPFLKGTVSEIKDKNPGMMTLIALAISVAFLYSSATVFGLEGNDFFWELATLIVIMLLGHWIEMRSVMNASKAIEKLAEMMPKEAWLVKDNETKKVSVDELKKGDIVLVKPGEKLPVDGVIVEGKSSIDESFVTGESTPVKKSKEDKVLGGSINGDGSIKVKITNLGKESYLSKVIDLVKDAQKNKSRTQGIADKAAFYLTIIAITVGITTFVVWLIITQDLAFSVTRMATVMVITCPHALGLAIPLVVAQSTAKAAQNGLLIRSRTAFENARNIDAIVFDKTGTLTEGSFEISTIKIVHDDYDETSFLKYVASAEQDSEHLLATGILKSAKKKEISLYDIEDFEAMKGKGIKATVNNKLVEILSPKAAKNRIDKEIELSDESLTTYVYVFIEDNFIGVVGLSDKIRQSSYNTIKTLKEKGIACYLASGDNEETTKKVSEALGLDGYYSEVLPDEKQSIIDELHKKHNLIAMTGDGVNDAPALAKADIGIAIGSGTDVAVETADIVLVNSDPSDILHLVNFGKKTYHKMIQNLIWATGYNIIAIPLAAGVLFSIGFIISPAIGAIFMSLSTIIVAINAKLLNYNQ
jgi:P-type Cu2+ transporter